MRSDGTAGLGLKSAAWLGLAFMHFPILVIFMYAFNTETSAFSFPLQGFTLRWFGMALGRDDVREAIALSLKIASLATVMAAILGTMAAAALYRRNFFGKEAITLMFILPIALPGIVTGIALLSAYKMAHIEPGTLTIVAGHATFCIVVVYNNVIARLRRLGTSLEEASRDLGADGFTTFRLITFPMLRGAFLAGGILAFGLSFDEIVVTLFTAPAGVTTLPIWIFQNLFRPNQAPIVNVVAAALVLLSILPIWLSQRLSAGSTAQGRL